MPIVSKSEWDAFLNDHPEAHCMQTSAWGELKSVSGWKQPIYMISGSSGAQILIRWLAHGIKIAYIPKGPVGCGWQSLWKEIDVFCARQGIFLLKVEPDVNEPIDDEFRSEMVGFRETADRLHPRRTIVIDLSGNETAWLARMKPKTRYNIKLATRQGIRVNTSNDFCAFSRIMEITAQRDCIKPRPPEYFEKINKIYSVYQNSKFQTGWILLLAEYQDQPLAGMMLLTQGQRALYLYGGSSNEHRNFMPTYLLMYEAMRLAAAQGCLELDLFGVPDYDQDNLEENFSSRCDEMWGLYRFKRGFGGTLVRHTCAWDRVYYPFMYRLYRLFCSLTKVYNRM